MNRFLNLIIRNFFFVAITIGVFDRGLAQVYNHFPVKNFGPKQYGLSQSTQNWCVTQSKEGLMYFGNSNGILEYDGRSWNLIPVISGSYVFSLATDNNNVMYAGTNGNFGYFKKNKKGKLNYVSLSDSLLPSEKRFFTTIWRIFVKGNEIYFQSEEAIFIYNKKDISIVEPEKSFHLAMQVDGDIYAREREVGLIKIEGNKKKIINSSPIASSYGLFGLLKDDVYKERLILVTQELGLFWLFKNGTLEEIPGQDKKMLIDSKIVGGIKLPGNRFAFNTELNGTIITDHHGKIVHFLNAEINIQNNSVFAQHVDKTGNLWLCLNKGISKVALHSPLQFFGPSDGLSGNVYGAFPFENSIYAASSDGVFIKKNTDAEFFPLKEIPFFTRQIMQHENKLLIASEGGLFLTDGVSVKKIMDGSFNALHYSESQKKIIAATKHDIYVLHQNLKEDFHLTITSGEIFRLAEGKTKSEDKNYIWLTTLSGGVYVIDLTSIPVRINDLSFSGGLPTEWLYPFCFKENLFLGCNYGILSPIGKSFDSTLLFEDADILNTEINESFSFYTQSATDKNYFVKENHVHYFPDASKANSNPVPFNPISIGKIHHLYSGSNQLLISGDDGLITFNENDTFNYNSGFSLILRNLSFKNDSSFYFPAKPNELKIESPLQFSQNSIKADFGADYYFEEDKLKFFARLTGQISDSINWNAVPEFEFNNLPEGNYTVTVIAKNIFEKISEPYRITFTIQPPWYRSTLAYTGYVIFILITLFLTSKLSSYRVKKKNKQLEEIISVRTAEIAGKNKELESRNEEILHQKKEITDSINYAKRIQNAMLPAITEIHKNMRDLFILFSPKDIVSGDFYWFHTLNENEFLIACADCTGHGVPGGFMSMVCADKLNEAVMHHQLLGDILKFTNRALKKSLRQDGSSLATKDGMEIALVKINTKTKKLHYAGANRFLWIIRKNSNSITDIKPTKTGIGGTTEDNQEFLCHEFSMESDDRIFLSSDGFGDQFGGEKLKKLTTKRFKEILIESSHLSIEEQRNFLNDFFEKWKGTQEQVDDILVIGTKF